MTREERMQDYIDGRMSPADRAGFESEMARDPELAEGVRFARELGRTLREEPIDLPAGFHARARERFEASRSKRFFLPRRLPWEVLGLAAAAAVVVALLFPWARNGRPESAIELAPSTYDTKQDLDDRSPRDAAAGARSKDEAEAPAIESDRLATHAKKAQHDAPMPTAMQAPSAPPAPLGKTIDAGDIDRGAATDDSRATLRTPESVAEPSARSQGFARSDEAQLKESVPRQELRAVALPPGLVPRGTLAIVEAATDPLWLRLTSSSAAPAVASLGPRFEFERVLVFGPQDSPVSCRKVRLSEEPEGLRVVVTPSSPADPASAGGCAVVIPRGNLPVVLTVGPENSPSGE